MSHCQDTLVRLAQLADAAAIAAIYNQGIEERNATFETELRTVEHITAQLAEKGEKYPTVVVERAGTVVAWAGVGPYRDRLCYAGIAQHSVYVERSARRTGAGRAALEGLLRTCEERGLLKLVSRILADNVG